MFVREGDGTTVGLWHCFGALVIECGGASVIVCLVQFRASWRIQSLFPCNHFLVRETAFYFYNSTVRTDISNS